MATESSCSWSYDNGEHCKTFLSSTLNGLDAVFERREAGVFSFQCQPSRFDACGRASGHTSPDQMHAVREEAVLQSRCDTLLSLPSDGNTLLRRSRQVSVDRLRNQFQFDTGQKAQQEQQQTAPTVARPIVSAFSSAEKLSYDRGDSVGNRTSELIQAVDDEDLKGVGESHRYVLSRRTGSDAGTLAKLQSSSNRMHTVQPTCSKLYVKASNVPTVEPMEESSRSSSFRSQSTCESGEREAGESSTSWHSNGSSQDASVNSKEQQTTTSDQESSKEKVANSESAAGHLNTGLEALSTPRPQSSPDPNSWLWFPCKLKDLFGSKKTPKPSARHENLTQEEQVPPAMRSFELSHGTNATTNPSLRAVRLFCSEQHAEAPALRTPCRHSYTETSSLSCKGSAFVSGTCNTPWMQRSNAKEMSTAELNRRATATGYAVYSKCLLPAFDDTLVSDGRGTILGSLSKMRERWLQYMKILKLPYGRKTSPGKPPELHTVAMTRPSPKIRPKTHNFPAQQDAVPSSPSAAADESGRPKSMPAIETSPVRPKSTSGAPGGLTIPRIGSRIPDHSTIVSYYGAGSRQFPSAVERAGFLSASSSPKFSNKLSMGRKVKNSPKVGSSYSTTSPRRSNINNSGGGGSNRSSTVSELHSSVQGAIAHCKKSHSAQLSQDCE